MELDFEETSTSFYEVSYFGLQWKNVYFCSTCEVSSSSQIRGVTRISIIDKYRKVFEDRLSVFMFGLFSNRSFQNCAANFKRNFSSSRKKEGFIKSTVLFINHDTFWSDKTEGNVKIHTLLFKWKCERKEYFLPLFFPTSVISICKLISWNIFQFWLLQSHQPFLCCK